MTTPLKLSKIEITDYATSIESTIFNQTKLTQHLASKFYRVNKVSLGLLPPVVRYITPNFMGYLLERPPEVRTVSYKDGMKGASAPIKLMAIKVPWSYFAVVLDPLAGANRGFSSRGLYAFFRTEQIWSEESELNHAYLPNIDTSGGVCISAGAYGLDKIADPVMALNHLIEGFWSCVFNKNLTSGFPGNKLPENMAKELAVNNTWVDYNKIMDYLQEVEMEALLKDTHKVNKSYPTVGHVMNFLDKESRSFVKSASKGDIDYYFGELFA